MKHPRLNSWSPSRALQAEKVGLNSKTLSPKLYSLSPLNPLTRGGWCAARLRGRDGASAAGLQMGTVKASHV